MSGWNNSTSAVVGAWGGEATTKNENSWESNGNTGADNYSGGDARVYAGHDDGMKNGDTGGGDDACRNCQQAGHFARDCPEPRKGGGDCFNCGQPGHSKSDCPNPRVFKGTCRHCEQVGHPAAECPEKPAEKCRNCQKEGHTALECKDNRVLDLSKIESKSPEEAWDALLKADKSQDLDDIRDAVKVYTKAIPDTTYDQLERAFRNRGCNTYLIAYEKELPNTLTLIDLQGKLDCKYQVGYYFGPKPKRVTASQGWPASPEENLERLKHAGMPMDRGIQKCSNCNELGHIAKACTEDKQEIERVEVKCVNCDETGHRARDCAQARKDRFACRNCKQSGHTAAECTEPRSAEGVKCKNCGEVGHFVKDCPTRSGPTCRNCNEEGHISKDCDKPRNPENAKCRNCEELGHFTKTCPLPKDWSKVKCDNCGEMGHGKGRCAKPSAEDGASTEGFNGGNEIAMDTAPIESSGGWNNNTAGGGW